jgi:hypothetical protein
MSNPQNNAAKNTQGAATTGAANYGATAAGINSVVTPELKQLAQNPTGYNPTDLNSMKVGAASAANSAAGSANENAMLRGERTGNNAAVSSAMDENARNRARVLADTNLKINTGNANLKQEQQQNALRELTSLYGTNTGAQIGETGNAISAEKLMNQQPQWLTDLQTGMGMAEKGAQTGADIVSY